MTDPLPLLFPLIRGLLLGTLVLLTGCAVVQGLARRHGAGIERGAMIRIQLGLLLAPRLLATFLLALCLARSGAQLLSFMAPGEPIDTAFARAILMEGDWGRANLLQTLTAALLFAACTLARSRPRELRIALAVALPVLLWSQSGLGHGMEERWPGIAGRLVHTAHLLGAGLWLGTLAILTFAVFPALRAAAGLRPLARIVADFSRVARLGAVLVIVSGVAGIWIYGASLTLFLDSLWGRLMIVKVVLFSAICTAGWWNWRVVTPDLQQELPGSPERLQRAVTAEVAFGALLLVVTALLVGSPLPAPPQ